MNMKIPVKDVKEKLKAAVGSIKSIIMETRKTLTAGAKMENFR